MSFALQMGLFLWVSLSIVFGLFTALDKMREELVYRQIFNWFISPFIAIAGLVFIERKNKRRFFKRLHSNLFIKN